MKNVVTNLHDWSRCQLFLTNKLFVAFVRILDQGLDGLLRLDRLFKSPHSLAIDLATKATRLEPSTEKKIYQETPNFCTKLCIVFNFNNDDNACTMQTLF